MALDSLAGAFTSVLALLRNHITTSAVTPTTLATSSTALRKNWNEKPGWPCFEIPIEMLEELRALGFSWTKIAELLGVSRWTVARRVEQHGLGDMRGFDYLPDEELDEIISTYIALTLFAFGLLSGYWVACKLSFRRIRDASSSIRAPRCTLLS